MLRVLILALFAGVFAANATPHFVKGITKEPFPSLFGPGPVVNVVAGWAMYVVAAVLLVLAHPARDPAVAIAAAGIGALTLATFHATIGALGRGE